MQNGGKFVLIIQDNEKLVFATNLSLTTVISLRPDLAAKRALNKRDITVSAS